MSAWCGPAHSAGMAWDACSCAPSSQQPCAGVMSAYGSFAPSSTNVYADTTIVAWADTGTSLLAGFAVFSILGNMAHRQTEAAASNPALRDSICEEAVISESSVCSSDFNCSACAGPGWKALGACCGALLTSDVVSESAGVRDSAEMAFSVRHLLCSTSVCLLVVLADE